MMRFSKESKRRRCPINEVPYDILREIFTRCLPTVEYSLHDRQPNAKVAPILLCQVCSSWRKVALSSATLWSHLSFRIKVQPVAILMGYQWGVFQRDLAFLRRWRKLHGLIPPHLSLGITALPSCDQQHADHLILNNDADATKFLLEYLSTAQYLDVDVFFLRLVLESIRSEKLVDFPVLHTLVRNQNAAYFIDHDDNIFHHSQIMIAKLPALRRLCINGDVLTDTVIPSHWLQLTSIYISEVNISLAFWYALIRAVPNLEFAFIDINHVDNIISSVTIPKYTHTRLATLFLEYNDSREIMEYPLRQLFAHLHLPALRNLSLMSGAESWIDPRALIELNAALASAPHTTALSLRYFLILHKPKVATISALRQETPIWTNMPHLVHLIFEMGRGDYLRSGEKAEQKLGSFIQHAFAPENRWLGLAESDCTIKHVTIVDKFLDRMEDFAMERAREVRERLPKIEFKITAESERTNAQDAWKGWGLRS